MDYVPIDADGHVMETDEELRRYLPQPFEGRRALTAVFPLLDGRGKNLALRDQPRIREKNHVSL